MRTTGHAGMSTACLLATLLGSVSPSALAVAEGQWSGSVFVGAGVDASLIDILPKAAKADLHFQRDWLVGVLARREIASPGWLTRWGRAWNMPVSSSVEAGAFSHSGRSDVEELTLTWRPSITPWRPDPIAVELAWGLGLSHTLGTPAYDGAGLDDPSQVRRTLFHMTPEIVLRHAALPGWSAGLRVHHRSGIYGVFAPRKVGSNHVGLILTREL